MTSSTTTTHPGKVAKGRKLAPQEATRPRRQLRWPRAELAAVVKELTGKAYGHDYLSEVARGARKNDSLKDIIDEAAEILDARHKAGN